MTEDEARDYILGLEKGDIDQAEKLSSMGVMLLMMALPEAERVAHARDSMEITEASVLLMSKMCKAITVLGKPVPPQAFSLLKTWNTLKQKFFDAHGES